LLHARISQASGHIQLSGPNLAGLPDANAIEIAPPAVLTPTGTHLFGRIISSSPIANGLALVQAVGNVQIDAQLSFAHDGVLRYEVTNWGSLTPLQTAIA